MTIQIYKLPELENIPEPIWLLEGILHQQTLAALVGTRGVFKTFLALDWGLCIATGREWQGRPTIAGNVLHIVGEGGRGIKRRAAAWRNYYGVAIEDTNRWGCTIKPIDVLSQGEELLRTAEKAFPDGVRLLVVDTLARNMVGDENNTQAMNGLVAQADKLKDELGATVLFLHHTNRQGAFRGNSALDGALDTIVLMQRKGEQVTVYNDIEHGGKQKDAEEFDPFVLRRKRIFLDGDESSSSIVLELDNESDPHMAGILSILDTGGARGVSREDAMLRAAETEVCKSTTFGKVWSMLKDKGLIELAEDSPKGRGAKWVRSMSKVDIEV